MNAGSGDDRDREPGSLSVWAQAARRGILSSVGSPPELLGDHLPIGLGSSMGTSAAASAAESRQAVPRLSHPGRGAETQLQQVLSCVRAC